MAEKPILNAASLLDLKAELLRKKEALKEAQLKRGLYDDFVGSKLKKIEKEPKLKKHTKPEKTPEINTEEELALKKSRAMLERKAALYEKLSKGQIVPDEEQSEHFLVNFDKKIGETPVEKREDNNSSTDALLHLNEIPLPPKTVKYSNFVPAQEMSSETTEENANDEENNDSGPVHYQNVHNKEVRNHGVGYFSFSANEEERKKQMEALNLLRHHTEDHQKSLLKKKRKRQAMLKSRLAKVRRRKNIPSKEDEDDDDLGFESIESEEEEEDIPIPEAESNPVKTETEEQKPVRVRPWDKGKDFSDLLPERKAKQHNVANQWLENKRAERFADFAPPQSYKSSMNRNQSQGLYSPLKTEAVSVEQNNTEEEDEVAKLIGERISFIRNQK